MKKKYKVIGIHEEKEINEIVKASSKFKAKAKAGFSRGLGGKRMKKFMNDKNVEVRQIY